MARALATASTVRNTTSMMEALGWSWGVDEETGYIDRSIWQEADNHQRDVLWEITQGVIRRRTEQDEQRRAAAAAAGEASTAPEEAGAEETAAADAAAAAV